MWGIIIWCHSVSSLSYPIPPYGIAEIQIEIEDSIFIATAKTGYI
jgi:hypothetical protein